jgi:DNA-directed RNA polymerase specialized sigma24 family protein
MLLRKNGAGGMSPDREARWSEWMGAAQSGDGRAYETLLREILPHVRDFIRISIPDEASAEDVAKTVLLSVHRARHSYRREQPFEPWLFAIVRKTVADFRRTRGRHSGPEGPGQDENAEAEGHPRPDKPIDIGDRKKRAPLLEDSLDRASSG